MSKVRAIISDKISFLLVNLHTPRVNLIATPATAGGAVAVNVQEERTISKSPSSMGTEVRKKN